MTVNAFSISSSFASRFIQKLILSLLFLGVTFESCVCVTPVLCLADCSTVPLLASTPGCNQPRLTLQRYSLVSVFPWSLRRGFRPWALVLIQESVWPRFVVSFPLLHCSCCNSELLETHTVAGFHLCFPNILPVIFFLPVNCPAFSPPHKYQLRSRHQHQLPSVVPNDNSDLAYKSL